MSRSESSLNTRIAALLFLLTVTTLLALHGTRVVLTNDEGILLEPAQRVAQGARPYVDFFAYMSPGSYWLQALVFRLLGISLWTGRLIVIFDFSLQCALVFWLAAQLASKWAAAMIALTFAGFQIADPAFLTAQHRWDSSTLALAGLALAVACVMGNASRWKWIVSGALLGAAAWCTPAVALAGAVVMIWLAAARARRRDLLPFCVGVFGVSAAAVAALAATGSFGGFVKQMIWLQKNYSAVNIMPYGSILGGYHALFAGVAGAGELAIRLVLVACLALPAILPVAALMGSAIVWKRSEPDSKGRRAIELLALAGVALVLTVFPRADIMHLAFVAAPAYVLTGMSVARLLKPRAAFPIAVVAMLLASTFAMNYVNGWRGTQPALSAVGKVRVPMDQAAEFQKLFATVHPGASLFVHPYLPIAYFLTQARNPTRYAYLNPGMMTHEDEMTVLTQLQADPPEWLLYLQLSREEFLRVFPHGEKLDWRYRTLETWMEQNYTPSENPAVTLNGYRLWRRAAISPPLSAAR